MYYTFKERVLNYLINLILREQQFFLRVTKHPPLCEFVLFLTKSKIFQLQKCRKNLIRRKNVIRVLLPSYQTNLQCSWARQECTFAKVHQGTKSVCIGAKRLELIKRTNRTKRVPFHFKVPLQTIKNMARPREYELPKTEAYS